MAITQTDIRKVVDILKSYGATKAILFGSAVYDPERARDIDIACDGVQGWRFFELGAKLEKELHKLVDLVPLNPPSRFTKQIEKKGRVIL